MDSQTQTPEMIGLVGAGLLGTVLGERLLAAGFRVLVWDRDPARVEALRGMGAEGAGDAAMIAARCERLVFSLPDSYVVTAVLEELDGALRAGQVIVDTSTGEPAQGVEFAKALATRGVAYLDATISGSSELLKNGQALCMVGGAAQTFAQCADLWAAFGPQTMHVGPSGSGARLKLVTNLVLGINRAALAEGLALAGAMGLDLRNTLAVLRASGAYSQIMDVKGEKMIRRDFAPQARLSQHLKDVRLILKSGAEAGVPLRLSETHREILERAAAAGLGDLDNSAIFEVMKRPLEP